MFGGFYIFLSSLLHVLLVNAGQYRSGDENRLGTQPPHEVAESFTAWVDDLRGSRHSVAWVCSVSFVLAFRHLKLYR